MRKSGGRILKKAEMPELDLLILEMPVRTLLSTVPEKGYKKFQILSGKLPWSHYTALMSISDDPARSFTKTSAGKKAGLFANSKRQGDTGPASRRGDRQTGAAKVSAVGLLVPAHQ